jgi:tRNA-splicing ligase RtcB
MYKFKKENMKVPCYVYSEQGSIEEEAIEQIENASSLPFAFHHTVLCPDGHQGYGAPIGGIFASKNVVIPNFVGVDIGCGMCAVRTSLTDIAIESIKKIMGLIRERVPVGFNHQKEAQHCELMPKEVNDGLNYNVICNEYGSALKQLGTLGGGNHFIEIQKGSDGFIWIMIHSGSRNLGKKVADYYNKIAVRLNEMWFSEVEKSKELAFLPIETNEAKQYIKEMNYCVEFALSNRKLMMKNIINCFEDVLNIDTTLFDNIINIAHNYAKWEHHYNTNVLIHRKGATSARVGEIGIIPGSMGTKSYIVEGLGNPESFMSCSHGAGRKMGRKQAQRELNLEEEIELLNKQGIIHGIRTINELDEAPGAYKNIDVIMENQKDLVKILVELKPLAVIKG